MQPSRRPLARYTIHIDDMTAEKLRNAAHALGQSQSALLVAAVVHHVAELERQYGTFPQRPSLAERLRAGGQKPVVSATPQTPLSQDSPDRPMEQEVA